MTQSKHETQTNAAGVGANRGVSLGRPEGLLMAAVIVYASACVVGITWGLPSRAIDPYLFPDGDVWTGRRILELSGGQAWSNASRGADVDADPLEPSDQPVNVTATEGDVAAIYLRYRLYTHQPDEMITMRSLRSMRPSQFQFDPRLYQYGGLFIYPVGALIRLCGMVGWIDVRADVAFYLDRPDEFGKFYVAARAYAALWGGLGLLIVWAIGRRLGGRWAGSLAALLFALMPVVVCMSHEGKPHLPGAVLMLAAVWTAMRYVESNRRRDWMLLAVTAGTAFGMVLSSLPIFVLIPLAEIMRGSSGRTAERQDATPHVSVRQRLVRGVLGGLLSTCVYLVTNPYIVINAFLNREVLKSNFGNSLAMYEVARVGQGLLRVLELTADGATPALLIIGIAVLAVALHRRRWDTLPLAVPAAVVFLQFVMLGAGKPAEYGRFGVLPDSALAIATACGLVRLIAWVRRQGWRVTAAASVGAAVLVVGTTMYAGFGYLQNMRLDTTGARDSTRGRAARVVAEGVPATDHVIGVVAEPAPYGCPPMDFANITVLFVRPGREATLPPDAVIVAACDGESLFGPRPVRGDADRRCMSVDPPFHTPISWANKPLRLFLPERRATN